MDVRICARLMTIPTTNPTANTGSDSQKVVRKAVLIRSTTAAVVMVQRPTFQNPRFFD
jgi:hypothetical protein